MNTPRKRFGQNFLSDPGIVDRILRNIDAKPGEHVIEIGPGRGAMTSGLAASGAQLTLIEIDRDLASQLKAKFPQCQLISDDVLNVDFNALGTGPFRVVGNLPYNISTPLMFKLLDYKGLFSDMHFMLQLEVVDRMTAIPSTKTYGRLSVMTQLFCNAEKLFEVPPEAFTPRPKVRSAIIRLQPKDIVDRHEHLESVLIKAFSARRKTVRNALKGVLSEEELARAGIDPLVRPENLSPSQYFACAHIISERGST